MRVIKIQRTISKNTTPLRSTSCRSIRQFARDFFDKENHLEFAIEALVFGVLLAISSWPILAAADAINRFL
jgi:hypothetical protein